MTQQQPFQVLCTKLQATINDQAYEMETLREVIRAVRRLHSRDSDERSGTWCRGCSYAWPCNTLRLVSGVVAERHPTAGVAYSEPPQMLVNMPVEGETGHD